jgi:hypothetical protein
MRVFPQKPQYVLVSNTPSHQKRTNPFSRAEKLGIALVLVLFLTYLVIFMQAVFNYFQHNHTQNTTTQARTHINPNSVQQGYSLDNISSGYPSFVAIPKEPIKDQADLYDDLVNSSDTQINADNIIHQLDKTVSGNDLNNPQTTQLAKLDNKQDRPKSSPPQESATPSEPKTSQKNNTKNNTTENKAEEKVSKQTPPKQVIAKPKKEEKPQTTVKEAPKPSQTVEKSAPEPKKTVSISTEQSPPALVKTEKTAPAPSTLRTTPSASSESFSVLEQSLGL